MVEGRHNVRIDLQAAAPGIDEDGTRELSATAAARQGAQQATIDDAARRRRQRQKDGKNVDCGEESVELSGTCETGYPLDSLARTAPAAQLIAEPAERFGRGRSEDAKPHDADANGVGGRFR